MTGSAANTDVTGSLWRALAVLRFVLLCFAIVVNALQWDGYGRPAIAAGVLAVMAAWSVAATWLYAAPRRRGAALPVPVGIDNPGLAHRTWSFGFVAPRGRRAGHG